MSISLPNGFENTLIWSEKLGYGFHTTPAMEYTGDYWEYYRNLDATKMGAKLTTARFNLVREYCDPSQLIDVGIGGGAFVSLAACKGFDVNLEAIRWLDNKYADPYKGAYAISCWDSLEHIRDPDKLLNSVQKWVFISMPIYDSLKGVLKSKHYKPGEHLWYWTLEGFINYSTNLGFKIRKISNMESDLGREGITTFVLQK